MAVWTNLTEWVAACGGLAAFLFLLADRSKSFSREVSDGTTFIFVVLDDLDEYIFGKPLISARCFIFSAFFTLATTSAFFAIVTYTYVDVYPSGIRVIEESNEDDRLASYTILFLLCFYLCCNVNLFFDYISLLITRLIIKRLKKTSKIVGVFAYLIFDFLSSIIISIMIVALFTLIFGYLFMNDGNVRLIDLIFSIPEAIGIALSGTEESAYTAIALAVPLVTFITSMFTSIWIWIYTIGWSSLLALEYCASKIYQINYLLPIAHFFVVLTILGIFTILMKTLF